MTPRRTTVLATHAVLIVVTALFMGPIVYALVKATQDLGTSTSTSLAIGDQLGVNARAALDRFGLGRMMGNTILVTLLVTLGKTVLALMAATAFVYFRFPLQGVAFALVLFTLMMPTEALIRALYDTVADFGMLDSYPGLVLPFLASATGTLLFRQHFLRIPRDLVDAAQVDGVGPGRFLRSFLVPLSWNVIGASAVIDVVYVWNMYLWPRWAVADPDVMMVQVGLVRLLSEQQVNHYGIIMAGAVVTMIPPLLVFVALQERFTRGFALNAGK